MLGIKDEQKKDEQKRQDLTSHRMYTPVRAAKVNKFKNKQIR